jgi:membrane protein
MSDPDAGENGVDRLRLLAAEVARRVGGLPAVRTLIAVLETYDRAGGGLTASGLAYTSLIALLPGLLLMVSIFGFLVDSEATREQLVTFIAEAVPPLEEFARTALKQVSGGAVPTGIVAVIGLLWGSSRFYAALDIAFSRIFHGARKRNEIERTVRGVLTTFLLVALPILALVVRSLVGWLMDLGTGDGANTAWQLVSPIGTLLLFVGAALVVFRFVPPVRVATRAYAVPAVLVGVILATFTQLFAFLGPLLTRMATIYGTFVAFFGVLAWLAISFNVLLLGASWARVRDLARGQPGVPAADPAAAGKAAGSPR